MAEDTGLLSGVRVLDLSVWRPGPYATQLLAEIGADVLKVEPPGGDPMRSYPELFASLNANKRSVVLDLKRDDDRGRGPSSSRPTPTCSSRASAPASRRGSAWATRTCAPSRHRSSTARCRAWGRRVRSGSCRVTISTTRRGPARSPPKAARRRCRSCPSPTSPAGWPPRSRSAPRSCAGNGRARASTSTPR